jgi:hypothetical protein
LISWTIPQWNIGTGGLTDGTDYSLHLSACLPRRSIRYGASRGQLCSEGLRRSRGLAVHRLRHPETTIGEKMSNNRTSGTPTPGRPRGRVGFSQLPTGSAPLISGPNVLFSAVVVAVSIWLVALLVAWEASQ